MNNKERIIIKLGGSIIVPEEIDISFLRDFKKFIVGLLDEGHSVCLSIGGGKTCRKYQDAATQLNSDVNDEDLDWIGLETCNYNALLLRKIFKGWAQEETIRSPRDIKSKDSSLLIVGADLPGHSSDYDAVEFAIAFGSKKIINLSNIAYAYTADPKIDLDAKKIEDVEWSKYRSYIPETWERPGMSTPFDPIASKKAEENGLEVAIIEGRNIASISSYIKGESFEGTLIHV